MNGMTLHAIMPDRAHEERYGHLTAFYKGIAFEVSVSPKAIKELTRTYVNDYIKSCLSEGKTIDGMKKYWLTKMNLFVDIYRQLIDGADRFKYLGKPYEVLVTDLIAEVNKTDYAGMFSEGEDKVELFLFTWIMGVGCLLKLKVIHDSDEDNGFQIVTGPKSLLEDYDEYKREKGIRESEAEEKAAEPSLP